MERELVRIPLFPLPKTVFFPHSLLRLHVFENRYRHLTTDCLAGDGRLAVAMLKPGWEASYYQAPPIYRTMGMGRIVDHQQLPDGKLEITLEGIARLRLLSELERDPYRSIEAEVLSGYSTAGPECGQPAQEAFAEMMESANRMLQLLPQFKSTVQKILAAHPHPGVVADLLAKDFVADAYEKQCILDEVSVPRRLRLVHVQLLKIVENFSRAHFRDRL